MNSPEYCKEGPLRTTFISTHSNKYEGVVSESLGAEVLAGDLIGEYSNSIKVKHFDLQLNNCKEVIDDIVQNKPEIIGISVKIGALEQLDHLINQINILPYKPLVVLGGVIPTFASVQLLEKHPNSLIVVGEGEMAMRGIVETIKNGRRLDSVPGITYIEEGSLKIRPTEKFNLKTIHLPARLTTKRIFEELNGLVWYEGSRGCDKHCTFCSRQAFRKNGFSGEIPPKHVVDDLEILSKMGIKFVHASDDDWCGDPERSLAIAEEIIARKINIKWSVSTRADHVWVEPKFNDNSEKVRQINERLIYIMQRQKIAGLDRIFLGLESFSESQLKRYGKQISVSANYHVLNILQNLGIDVVAGYIPIDPLMTLEELHENLLGLRITGMYKKVTNPLSILRIQEGSPYLQMVRNKEKTDNKDYIGARTKDLVFYEITNYADPRIQIIANLADKWVTEMYPLIYSLKMEVFSSTQDSRMSDVNANYCEDLLFKFRELEMKLIESATLYFINGGKTDSRLNRLIKRFVNQRSKLISDSRKSIESLNIKFKDPSLNQLICLK